MPDGDRVGGRGQGMGGSVGRKTNRNRTARRRTDPRRTGRHLTAGRGSTGHGTDRRRTDRHGTHRSSSHRRATGRRAADPGVTQRGGTQRTGAGQHRPDHGGALCRTRGSSRRGRTGVRRDRSSRSPPGSEGRCRDELHVGGRYGLARGCRRPEGLWRGCWGGRVPLGCGAGDEGRQRGACQGSSDRDVLSDDGAAVSRHRPVRRGDDFDRPGGCLSRSDVGRCDPRGGGRRRGVRGGRRGDQGRSRWREQWPRRQPAGVERNRARAHTDRRTAGEPTQATRGHRRQHGYGREDGDGRQRGHGPQHGRRRTDAPCGVSLAVRLSPERRVGRPRRQVPRTRGPQVGGTPVRGTPAGGSPGRHGGGDRTPSRPAAVSATSRTVVAPAPPGRRARPPDRSRRGPPRCPDLAGGVAGSGPGQAPRRGGGPPPPSALQGHHAAARGPEERAPCPAGAGWSDRARSQTRPPSRRRAGADGMSAGRLRQSARRTTEAAGRTAGRATTPCTGSGSGPATQQGVAQPTHSCSPPPAPFSRPMCWMNC